MKRTVSLTLLAGTLLATVICLPVLLSGGFSRDRGAEILPATAQEMPVARPFPPGISLLVGIPFGAGEGRTSEEFLQSPTEVLEPTIGQLQQAAVQYAEVSPEKISRWRTQARLQAFIPRLTLSLDRDQNANIASSTSKGVTRFAVGPTRRNLSVDLDFTWDLGDLIWSSAQTSIDVRSRLMVKLRQETLEEVTQLYFERKRLNQQFKATPTEDPILKSER